VALRRDHALKEAARIRKLSLTLLSVDHHITNPPTVTVKGVKNVLYIQYKGQV
jgi:hypothetical protein